MRRLLIAAGLLALAAPLVAQPVAPENGPRAVSAPAVIPPTAPAAQETVALGPGFLLSAIVPGAAQYRAGDGRWVPYVAVEVWAWLSYLQQQQTGRNLARRYRDVAWQVARRVSVSEERRDTVFAYYEAMANRAYPASGAFDSNAAMPGIQPERAPQTFNGQIWDLARRLYLGGREAVPGSPGYDAALAYYERRAIPDGYAWAWGVSTLEQRAFRQLIQDSDAAFASAKQYLGLILANHITSTVDALVTERLRQLGARGVEIETVPARDAGGFRLEHGVRITF